jgi:hypothetical protein
MDMILKGQAPSAYGNQDKDLRALEFDRVSTDFIGENSNYDQWRSMKEGRYVDQRTSLESAGLIKK